MSDLVARTTRGIFSDLMTRSTIGAAFQDEGIAPNPGCTYQDTSVRRETTQAYPEVVARSSWWRGVTPGRGCLR